MVRDNRRISAVSSLQCLLTLRSLLALLAAVWLCSNVTAQNAATPTIGRLMYDIQMGEQKIQMAADSSRIMRLKGKRIPKVLVENPEVIHVIAVSPSELQVSGKKPGVTRVSVWDDEGNVYTLDMTVYRDGKALRAMLAQEFPAASVRVRPLESSVMLSGWVDDPESISMIVRMAEDYYPKVINNLRVGNNQQVMLNVRVMEVSRTKLRRLGVDWAVFGSSDFVAQTISGLIQETTSNARSIVGTGGSTITLGLTGGSSNFFAVIDALRQHDLAKVLAEPVLTTISGRAASFNVGGEFPILVPQGLGTVGIEYKSFGTKIDFVPIVLGDGNIRLEVRPEVSEIDNARGVDVNGFRVPGIRTRTVDTAVEMRAGQTLALAGLIQERVESQSRGLPVLADLPVAGAMFRRVVDTTNEIELLILVRPELVDAMDPHEVPLHGPGTQSGVPNDHDFYLGGVIETPKCTVDGPCIHHSHAPGYSPYAGSYPIEGGTVVQEGTYAVPESRSYGSSVLMDNAGEATLPTSVLPVVPPTPASPVAPVVEPESTPLPMPTMDFGSTTTGKPRGAGSVSASVLKRGPASKSAVQPAVQLAPVVRRRRSEVQPATAWMNGARRTR